VVESHLYIEPDASEFRPQDTVHRALKKSDFFVFFAFDLPEPRTYNPRPRCFAADANEASVTVEFRRENRLTALFDIVI
jgi:hypothetical protein